MNIKLILLFLLSIAQISWAQNCDFKIHNLNNVLNGESELIEKSEYEKVKEILVEFVELTPISEQSLNEKYPGTFKIIDSCYFFNANLNNRKGLKAIEIKACKNKIQTKEYSDYKFKGVYYNNALIKVIGYESNAYLSVDLITGLTCYTIGIPLTSDGITIISYLNYYGDAEATIDLTNLKTKKQYVIVIQGWLTKEIKVLDDVYYLKLEPEFHTSCKKKTKYLKIKLTN